MSYCVNCGVELDDTAAFCPLCHTPVHNPNQPVNQTAAQALSHRAERVPPASKLQVAILLSTILASVAVCSGVLNVFLRTQRTWSLYVIGAALMIWIWTVPPLLHHRKDTFRLQLLADVLAIAVYVSLIAVDLDGWDWYWHLALPIILLLGALFLFWGLTMGRRKRSTLTSMTLVIGSIGVFILGVERFVDLFFLGHWSPGWSLIVLAVCVILIIPLIVVRRVPSLREEVRRPVPSMNGNTPVKQSAFVSRACLFTVFHAPCAGAPCLSNALGWHRKKWGTSQGRPPGFPTYSGENQRKKRKGCPAVPAA